MGNAMLEPSDEKVKPSPAVGTNKGLLPGLHNLAYDSLKKPYGKAAKNWRKALRVIQGLGDELVSLKQRALLILKKILITVDRFTSGCAQSKHRNK